MFIVLSTMQYVFPDSEPIRASPWKKGQLPQKVLIIRFHGFGDVQIAMAASQALKELHPEIELQLLTGGPSSELPCNMPSFSKVHILKHARGGWPMAFSLLSKYPTLLQERFDVVIDLQNNMMSRLGRKLLFPTAWTQFDRFSRIHALRRYENAINAIGIGIVKSENKISLHDEKSGLEKLYEKGWNEREKLVLLNPCGLFPSRQWSEDHYLDFALLWLAQVDSNTKFVLLGYPGLLDKTRRLVEVLGASCINLIGKTSTKEVFNIVRQVNLTLSDDGALLHTSWVNHVPTIGFLGASPSYWCRPLGSQSFGFTSDDLSCANCHRTECLWGDNRCLMRVTPQMAMEQARILIDKI